MMAAQDRPEAPGQDQGFATNRHGERLLSQIVPEKRDGGRDVGHCDTLRRDGLHCVAIGGFGLFLPTLAPVLDEGFKAIQAFRGFFAEGLLAEDAVRVGVGDGEALLRIG